MRGCRRTRQKKEQTIASQTSNLRSYAQKLGLVVADDRIFVDQGYSGTMLACPRLGRVHDLAAEGRLETLLVYSPDRLSRKYPYQVLLMEEIERNGVEICFVNSPTLETPEDHLLVQFQGSRRNADAQTESLIEEFCKKTRLVSFP